LFNSAGQSKDSGRQEVESILVLEDTLKTRQKHMQQLEGQLTKKGTDVVEVVEQLQDVRASCTRLSDTIRRKRATLGVGQRKTLKNMKDNSFLQLRMNARAVKTRIRDCLRQRKFELERLERSYRHGKVKGLTPGFALMENLERKLTEHTKSTVKRREPGISKLVKTYNDHCKEMQTLAKQWKAPRSLFVPQPIDSKKLFALDVDDNIWQDAGLDGEEDGMVPLWLGNEDVRKGIKYLLVLDRCLEEEIRLKQERAAMQLWLREEWEILQRAIAANGVYDTTNTRFC
jgi:hypothetical protein